MVDPTSSQIGAAGAAMHPRGWIVRSGVGLLASVCAVLAIGGAAQAATRKAGAKAAAARAAESKAADSTTEAASADTPAVAPGASQTAPAATTGATPTEAAPAQQTWLSADDLRLGDFKVPPAPYPFPLLGDERAKEVYVDRDGNLYKERKYSGVIPAWGQSGALRRGRCQVVPQTLDWVGFQNNFDSSRVFIAVQGEACGYVYRPDELHIVIDLPAVKVENPNLLRDILTGAFPTPVQLIRVEELGGRGTRVTIALREPRPYLSAHIGKYVFVDVSR